MRRRRGEVAGFDRVIVETSGIADPGPVAQTLFADQALARDFKLGPIVTVVDAADPGNRRSAWGVARAQIAAADVVVLSKVDRPSARPEQARREIESLNPTAACIEASFGALDPGLLQKSGTQKSATDHVFSGAAAHATGIHSFTLKFDNPVPKDLLERFLGLLVELRGADLLRVKGVVALEGGERVLVQGVRHVFDRLRPIALRETGLVFVTNQVSKSEVEELWKAMSKLKGRR
jgi:G3E family GTPase